MSDGRHLNGVIRRLLRAINEDEGVSNDIYHATYTLIQIHFNDDAAKFFSRMVDGTDDMYYFPDGNYKEFLSFPFGKDTIGSVLFGNPS